MSTLTPLAHKVPPDQTAELRAANSLSVGGTNPAKILLEKLWVFIRAESVSVKTILALELFLHIVVDHYGLILGSCTWQGKLAFCFWDPNPFEGFLDLLQALHPSF